MPPAAAQASSIAPAAEAPRRPAPRSRPSAPRAEPGFGALAEKKKLPLPLLVVGGAAALGVLLLALSRFVAEPAPAEEAKAEAKAEFPGAAPAAAKTSPAAAKTAPAPAKVAPAPARPAPAPARPEAKAPDATKAADSRAASLKAASPDATSAKAAAPRPEAKPERFVPAPKPPGRKSFLERVSERREARVRAQQEAVAEAAARRGEGKAAPSDPAAVAAPAAASTAAQPASSTKIAAPAAASTAAQPASSTKSAAPAAASAAAQAAPSTKIAAPLPAAAAAPPASAAPQAAHASASPPGAAAAGAKAGPAPSGAIAGLDDDGGLLASKPRKVALAPAAAQGEEACPAGMKLIPGGAARVGTEPSDDLRNFGDRGPATVSLRPFCIDQFEFPGRPGQLPKVAAAYAEAEAACRDAGRRLCTEDEWEKSCRGPQDLRFPYGAEFDARACNTQDQNGNPRKLTAVGIFGTCKSGYGVFDLSGNAAEWTASSFQPGAAEKTVKGGSASRPGFDDRCSSRRPLAAGAHDLSVGFRCCADAK
jgi:eukaryotic-like serine/threonine-protein kinase